MWKTPGLARYTVGDCRMSVRRWRIVLRLGHDALLARGGGLAYAHVIWGILLGLVYLALCQPLDLLHLAVAASLAACLMLITLMDIRYLIILPCPLAIVCGLGIVLLWAEPALVWWDKPAAFLLGYGVLAGIDVAYYWARGRHGLGRGDAKLLAVSGLFVGLTGLPWTMVFASGSALLCLVLLLARGETFHRHSPLPFGPHLALGLWLTWIVESVGG